jgi:hypothetical protein
MAELYATASSNSAGNFVLPEPFQHEMMSSEWRSVWRHEGMAAFGSTPAVR